jgi:hypothetical protein
VELDDASVPHDEGISHNHLLTISLHFFLSAHHFVGKSISIPGIDTDAYAAWKKSEGP